MILVRRVVGTSMSPALLPGQLIIAIRTRRYKHGEIVVFSHEGKEKIKRIIRPERTGFWVEGDNPNTSTDSRQYGAITRTQLLAKLIWPRSKHNQ